MIKILKKNFLFNFENEIFEIKNYSISINGKFWIFINENNNIEIKKKENDIIIINNKELKEKEKIKFLDIFFNSVIDFYKFNIDPFSNTFEVDINETFLIKKIKDLENV